MAATAANLVFDTSARDRIAAIPGRLRKTFRSGRTRPIAWRLEQLRAVEKLLRENSEALQKALASDLGKPALEAMAADIGMPLGEASLAIKNLSSWMRPKHVAQPLVQRPGKSWIQYDPLGVILIIAPWNYPVQLTFNPLVAAIAAGNCAVIKPSEMTPATSKLIAELVPKYLDNDCIAVVEGAVDETGVLLEQQFDHILYTGNGRVARIVMEAAAKHLTPVTLELGGKSPCIVMEDANLDVAAHRIAWGKWTNAGQTCTAPDYVLVHESVEKPLVDKLKAVLKEFYGENPRQSKDYPRIVSDRHVDRLAALIEDGTEVAAGGEHDRAERYFAPTILTGVKPDSKAMADEIFGPVLPMLTIGGIDQAIDFINDRDKPLALYVFTADSKVSDRVLTETSSGGACVNATLWHVANPNLPFGGVGPSGMGAYHGRWGFEALSHRKAVTDKPTSMDAKVAYPPYTKIKEWLVRKFM
ncbi:MAG TPA: aldehyde dehydrogenase family protein [Candidatus Limnocylindrales bacterium]|nr:aldehyde dehydrogenase family protein [Candidatus Limnocylindrales bacterium]